MGLFKPNGHEEITVLKDVSFDVEEGEFLGIIGDNGSGKSTLLKIIARILRPSQGSIDVVGRVTPFLELGVGFHPELTVRENIGVYGTIMGLSRREINDRMEEIIDFAGLQKFSNAKLKNLSSGMQVRLAFSTAVQTEPNILLVDEVLAVGDMEFHEKCYNIFNRYKKEGVTVLFVSHDLGSVRRFCDRTLLLKRGEQIALGDTEEILDRYIYGSGMPTEVQSGVNHALPADSSGTSIAKTATSEAPAVDVTSVTEELKGISGAAEVRDIEIVPFPADAPEEDTGSANDAIKAPPSNTPEESGAEPQPDAEECEPKEITDSGLSKETEPEIIQTTVDVSTEAPAELKDQKESRQSESKKEIPPDAPTLMPVESTQVETNDVRAYKDVEATPLLVDEPKEDIESESNAISIPERGLEEIKAEIQLPAMNLDFSDSARWGNECAKIVRVRFLNKFGIENTRFFSGDPMRIRMNYYAPSKIRDPIFGIALYSEKGYYLYGTNTDLKGIRIDNIEGDGYIDLDIERLPMLSGRFMLTVAVVARDHKPYDWIDKQFSFEVIPKGKDDGIFEIPCKWVGKSDEILCVNAKHSEYMINIGEMIQQLRSNISLRKDICINIEIDNSELWCIDKENDCYFVYGWHDPESWKGISTRWMKEKAILGVYSEKSRYAVLTFKAISFYRARNLEIYGIDCLLKEEIAPNNFNEICVTTHFKQGLNILWLHIPEGCDIPSNMPDVNSKDERNLSIAIQCINLQDLERNPEDKLIQGKLPKEPFKPGTSERSIEIPWAISCYNGEERVLDVGFANAEGRYLQKLLSLKIPYLFGIDIVKKRLDGISSIVGDLRNIPFQSNYFDLISCISTIEHIGRDNTIYKEGYCEKDNLADFKAIRELSRIVKNQGKIIITVPFGKFHDYEWFIQYDEARWDSLIQESGCKVIRQDFFLYDKGWKSCRKHELSDILYKDNNAPAAAGLACVLLEKDCS